MKRINSYPRGLDTLQKISVSLMGFLVLVTFVGANLHAVLWQQSSWLVSTVLPAVVVDLTNEEREDIQAPELRRNATLDEAARMKAKHMAEHEYFSHYSPSGVSPWHWFTEADYTFAHAGENLAIHFTDSSEVVEAWMESPTHRANIVNKNYTEIGVGTAKGTFDGYNTVYVVQLFGAPAYSPKVEPTPIPELVEVEPDTSAELAEISNTLDELALAVEELESNVLPSEISETPEVLAEHVDIELEETNPTLIPVEVIELPNNSSPEVIESDDTVSESLALDPELAALEAPQDVLVVESTISTSSGLAVASITESPVNRAGTTMVSMVTQPNSVLQLIYMFLGMVVMALLLFSALFEARQLHFVQVSYSFALMLSMGALWYVHNLLTEGAVII